MAIVSKSALVHHSAAQMFQLVRDVEAYPGFLPWCQATRILSREEGRLCAELVVARMGIRQTFSTCNRFVEDEWMELDLLDGPFKYMRGRWSFLSLREDACKVALTMDFEFAGALIDKAFGAVFHQIANSLVDAFCKRADEVYRG
ncbi:MAG: type II toxin-antitoxin system RatA family toxin [Chromatiaceae bacterium]|nr:type II toxin-antitoxin system RatA family toxin [Chromatiaceae bacterium]